MKADEDTVMGNKKMDTLTEDVVAEDLDSDGEGNDDIVFFVEYKYCTICHLE